MRLDADVGVQGGQARLRALELGPPDPGRVVEDLALEVALVDDVEVHDADTPHARRGEVEGRRRAQASRTHQQRARALEAALPVDRDLRHDQVARVAGDLLAAEVDGGGVKSAPRDRGHDRELVALREARLEPGAGAGVLAVDVDVHEAAQRAVLRQEVRPQPRRLGDEGVEHRLHGLPGERHRRPAAGVGSKRGGDPDAHAHVGLLSGGDLQLELSERLLLSRDFPRRHLPRVSSLDPDHDREQAGPGVGAVGRRGAGGVIRVAVPEAEQLQATRVRAVLHREVVAGRDGEARPRARRLRVGQRQGLAHRRLRGTEEGPAALRGVGAGGLPPDRLGRLRGEADERTRSGAHVRLPEAVGEVAVAAVREHHRDRPRPGLAPRPQRGRHRGPARGPDEEPLLAAEAPGHLVRLLRPHRRRRASASVGS